jgi:hypothetical protein
MIHVHKLYSSHMLMLCRITLELMLPSSDLSLSYTEVFFAVLPVSS